MTPPLPTRFRLGPNAAFHHGALSVLVPTGTEGFEVLRAYVDRRAAEVGRKVVLMVVVRPGVSVDPGTLRADVHALLDEAAASLEHLVLAIDGHGFFASTFMSIASMLFIHTRHAKTPVRVFKSLDDAGAFIAGILPGTDWVVPYVESVRRALASER